MRKCFAYFIEVADHVSDEGASGSSDEEGDLIRLEKADAPSVGHVALDFEVDVDAGRSQSSSEALKVGSPIGRHHEVLLAGLQRHSRHRGTL